MVRRTQDHLRPPHRFPPPAAGLRVRYSPGGVVVGRLREGTRVTVTDGPVTLEGQTWYRVLSVADRIEGWVVGDYLSGAE